MTGAEARMRNRGSEPCIFYVLPAASGFFKKPFRTLTRYRVRRIVVTSLRESLY